MTGKIDYKLLRRQLQDNGAVHLVDPEGRRLFLVLSRNLDMDVPGILLAYEGEGVMFFELDRPLNAFRLLGAGFSTNIAPTLSDTVNAILGMGASESGVYEPTMIPFISQQET